MAESWKCRSFIVSSELEGRLLAGVRSRDWYWFWDILRMDGDEICTTRVFPGELMLGILQRVGGYFPVVGSDFGAVDWFGLAVDDYFGMHFRSDAKKRGVLIGCYLDQDTAKQVRELVRVRRISDEVVITSLFTDFSNIGIKEATAAAEEACELLRIACDPRRVDGGSHLLVLVCAVDDSLWPLRGKSPL